MSCPHTVSDIPDGLGGTLKPKDCVLLHDEAATPSNNPLDKAMTAHDRLEELTFQVLRWNYGASSAETRTEHYRAAHALHQDILALLPQKQEAFGEHMYPGKHDFDNQYKFGYNQAIADMTAKLDAYFKGGK